MHPPRCGIDPRKEGIKLFLTHLSIAKTVYDGNKKSLEGGRNNKLMGI